MTAQANQVTLLTGFVHFDHIRTQESETKMADLGAATEEGVMAMVM